MKKIMMQLLLCCLYMSSCSDIEGDRPTFHRIRIVLKSQTRPMTIQN